MTNVNALRIAASHTMSAAETLRELPDGAAVPDAVYRDVEAAAIQLRASEGVSFAKPPIGTTWVTFANGRAIGPHASAVLEHDRERLAQLARSSPGAGRAALADQLGVIGLHAQAAAQLFERPPVDYMSSDGIANVRRRLLAAQQGTAPIDAFDEAVRRDALGSVSRPRVSGASNHLGIAPLLQFGAPADPSPAPLAQAVERVLADAAEDIRDERLIESAALQRTDARAATERGLNELVAQLPPSAALPAGLPPTERLQRLAAQLDAVRGVERQAQRRVRSSTVTPDQIQTLKANHAAIGAAQSRGERRSAIKRATTAGDAIRTNTDRTRRFTVVQDVAHDRAARLVADIQATAASL